MSHKIVYVAELPDCDMCGDKARYDAKILGGGWAKVCEQDFQDYGCELGLGKGQELVVGEKPKSKHAALISELADLFGEGEEEMEMQMEDYGLFD